MFEYENKLEVLEDKFPDPENWVVYLDPENEQPNIVSSKVRDEWIFQDAKVYGSANIDFKVTGEDEVIVYTDPTNPRYIITASAKQDWFNSFGFSGRSKDFMEEANKLGEEKASRYKAIVDLHLALYNVR